ncbi:hypothetical protein HAX54_040659 [Datura stramonium]|uniref:Uncharacterized protein n=1 Tax=Datura stramonium TaxID=4076 RepID=A0ABS8SKP8_DATST|nr:hypothetical protein [Datura stramonium]
MPSDKRGRRNWNGLFELINLSGPKHVLPWSMVQPGLAMEQTCELGTPFRDLHRLDKEFQLMGRDLPDPQLQALEWEQDLLLLIIEYVVNLYGGSTRARLARSVVGVTSHALAVPLSDVYSPTPSQSDD